MRCPIKLGASAPGGFEAPQGELALKGWMASIPCYRPSMNLRWRLFDTLPEGPSLTPLPLRCVVHGFDMQKMRSSKREGLVVISGSNVTPRHCNRPQLIDMYSDSTGGVGWAILL